MHEARRNALNIRNWAVVVFDHPLVRREHVAQNVRRPADIAGFTLCHCRVVGINDDLYSVIERKYEHHRVSKPRFYETRERPSAGSLIEVDQTLRNALGIPFWVGRDNYDIPLYVYPARRASPLRSAINDKVTQYLGRRFLLFRIGKSAVPDIEKQLARMESEYFPVLGMPVGSAAIAEVATVDRIDNGKVVDFMIVRKRIKAFEAGRRFMDERSKLKKDDPVRYFPADVYLYKPDWFLNDKHGFGGTPTSLEEAEPDIPPFFVDAHFRMTADKDGKTVNRMNDTTVVSVRRDLTDIFARELQEFGIGMALSLLPLFIFFLERKENSGGTFALLGIAVILPFVIFLMLLIRIRRQVR